MKIFALIGSPRKGSNTDILVDKILMGAGENGNSFKKIYLYDFDISACIDCRKCKRSSFVCAFEDGMSGIYPKLEEADLIIFGTPVYWYGPDGKDEVADRQAEAFYCQRKAKREKRDSCDPVGGGGFLLWSAYGGIQNVI